MWEVIPTTVAIDWARIRNFILFRYALLWWGFLDDFRFFKTEIVSSLIKIRIYFRIDLVAMELDAQERLQLLPIMAFAVLGLHITLKLEVRIQVLSLMFFWIHQMKKLQTMADLSKNYYLFFNITRNFDGLKATFSYLIDVPFQQIKLQTYCILYCIYAIVNNNFIS